MTCDAALQILLETDPGSLGRGDHAGADHLARCPTCRRAVHRILEGDRLLDGWLEAAPRPDTEVILARAGVEGGRIARVEETDAGGPSGGDAQGAPGSGGRSDGEDGPSSSGEAPGRRIARAGAWVALAAAAVAAVFLVGDPAPPSGSGALDEPLSRAEASGPEASPTVALAGEHSPARSAGPDIEVPTGRNAAILRTGNPDITIIWFYGGDG